MFLRFVDETGQSGNFFFKIAAISMMESASPTHKNLWPAAFGSVKAMICARATNT